MSRPRVVLADDHEVVRDGIQRLLEREFEIVETASDGCTLLDVAQSLDPDVLVVDISMPCLNGIEAARALRKLDCRGKIVFLSSYRSPAVISEAFAVGASSFVFKPHAAEQLPAAIREALANRNHVNPLPLG